MNIKSLMIGTLCLLASVGAIAEQVQTQTFDIGDVREIVASGAAEIHIRQGATPSLRAEGTEEVLSRLIVKAKGDRLTLGVKPEPAPRRWFGGNHETPVFFLELPELSLLHASKAVIVTLDEMNGTNVEIKLSGASRVSADKISIFNLDAELSGASRIETSELSGESARIALSGASRIDVSAGGQLKKLDVHASGASRFEGSSILSQQVRASASGASNILVHAEESLDGNASGASHIRYKGDPRVQQRTSGASSFQTL
ncbi:GIN domain-containing protein [Marinimicrobium sp. ABcell2]|uniref:GIN domain-containing protein n=1 Tax=Marinimicrobium sp. ABcell2 TaxID=3069751 RepID=UPI0027B2C026|nr:DUF2807 domain-containing protein [Marinimicrobium sp. ABcell2]MDQ2076886.1 DUF2807 domain-containing protein [Marinimicrobium sp. ABcell2]